MKYTALVPVKRLARAKSRLAPYLTSIERETLVLSMLTHVLGVLRLVPRIDEIIVVSADGHVLEQASVLGAKPMIEEQVGHNAALRAAALRTLASGSRALLTISADLPLLTTADIHALIERSTRCEVVLAPSHEGTGTNALLVRPPLAVPYLFGVNSLERYLRAASYRRLSSSIYRSLTLARDIDTIEDIQEWHRLEYEMRQGGMFSPRAPTATLHWHG